MGHIWGKERCVRGLVGAPEGKGPLGRLRRKWKNKIKLNL